MAVQFMRVARVLAILATTAVLYAAFLVTRRRRLVRMWMSAMARILGVRAEVSGPRPAGAFLLVSNHLGFLDITTIGAAVDVVFVAKSEVQSWPLLGHLSRITGTIFIDRSSQRDAVRVSNAIGDAIKNGRGVAIFPEGTATDGRSMLPFKSALLEVAARERMPVHYAALAYDRDEAKWYGDESFGANFWKLLGIRRVHARLEFGGTVAVDDRKELARELRDRILTLSGRFTTLAVPPVVPEAT